MAQKNGNSGSDMRMDMEVMACCSDNGNSGSSVTVVMDAASAWCRNGSNSGDTRMEMAKVVQHINYGDSSRMEAW